MHTGSPRKVLIVFSDQSLGGTSRSAYLAGRAWKHAGFDVEFHPTLPIHPGRKDDFEKIGPIFSDLRDVDTVGLEVVHYHHGAWSPRQKATADSLITHARIMPNPPLLISNNIFAVRDELLDRWPGRRVTTVLGLWASGQYRSNAAYRRRAPFVVPNSQDDARFRLPTSRERFEARKALGLHDEVCLLRLGSPHDGKWSRAYIRLARKARGRDASIILVGVPDNLRKALESETAIRIMEPTESDAALRQLYWASDAFILDAVRGESFGNVVFEALLCGTPVIYRGRPLRDNTPWELRSVPGFTYSRGSYAWLSSALAVKRKELLSTAEFVDRGYIAEKYKIETVAAQLMRIVTACQRSSAEELEGDSNLQLSYRERLLIAVRHNPFISKIKQMRLDHSV